MKRHMETCDAGRAHKGMASRKRRACDRCARQKKACNAMSPCQTCQKRGLSCHYSYLSCSAGPSTGPTSAADDNNLVSDMAWRADDIAGITAAITNTISTVCDPSNQALSLQYGDFGGAVHNAVSDISLLDSHVNVLIDQEWPGFMSPPATYGVSQPIASSQSYQSNMDYQESSFHFLAGFTSRSGLVESFDCGTLSQRREVVSSFVSRSVGTFANASSSTQAASPLDTETGGLLVEFDDSCDDLSSSSLDFPASTSGWQSWLDNPVVIKLQQIILRIKEVVVIKPRNSTVTLTWSPELERKCLDFFSVTRFGKFLELYWSVWHPNVNFLHRPTFDPMNTPTTLLAAMALIGI